MKRPAPPALLPDTGSDLGCACAKARQAARVLTQFYDAKLRSSGMEAPQFALLMTLQKAGPCSQVDLGRQYALDKTTVSRNLKLLERNGWVQSSPGSDRRERWFTLTGTGRRKLDAARLEWKKAQNQLRSTMTGGQWESMFRVLTTIIQAARTLQEKDG